MPYSIIFSPEAEEQLIGLYKYVAKAASSETAKEFTDDIVNHCEGLKDFPQRGTLREDIRPGLRITHFKKHTIIAFAIMNEKVVILAIYYGGQNYEEKLNDDTQ
jgi:toxin ParE1/3/4